MMMDLYTHHESPETPAGEQSLRKVLVKGWKLVDDETRKKT